MPAETAPGRGPDAAGPRRRRPPIWRLAIAAAVVVGGIKLLDVGATALTGPPVPARDSLFGSWSGPAAAPLPASVPVRVRIPSVGIDAPLIRLGLQNGAVAVPPVSDAQEAGWFTGNPTPGERGAAVIVGHVDTDRGRAVFYPLGKLQPGATIIVDRADKRHANFRVTSMEIVDRNDFPSERVYGTGLDKDPNSAPQLRVITCGGAFDGQHYDDSLVIYAQLVGST